MSGNAPTLVKLALTGRQLRALAGMRHALHDGATLTAHPTGVVLIEAGGRGWVMSSVGSCLRLEAGEDAAEIAGRP